MPDDRFTADEMEALADGFEHLYVVSEPDVFVAALPSERSKQKLSDCQDCFGVGQVHAQIQRVNSWGRIITIRGNLSTACRSCDGKGKR